MKYIFFLLLVLQFVQPQQTTAQCSAGISTLYGFPTSANSQIMFWTPVPDATLYQFRYKLVSSSTWIYITSLKEYRHLTGLATSVLYECQVRAKCPTGYTAWTASGFFCNNSEGTPYCTASDAKIAVSIGVSYASLYWKFVQSTTQYEVRYRKFAEGDVWTTLPVTGTNQTINGLNSSKTYEYQVRSKCGNVNWSAWSVSGYFTTTSALTNAGSNDRSDEDAVESKELNLKIWPNPVQDSDLLHVETNAEIRDIEVLDMTGKVVLTSTDKTMTVETLKKGVYIVRVNYESGDVKAQKLIVN